MSENSLIGSFREKRGDDTFKVVVSPNGNVIGIEQFDYIRGRWNYLNLFVESVPELIALLQSAARVDLDYEYAVEQTNAATGEKLLVGGFRKWYNHQKTAEAMLEVYEQEKFVDTDGKPAYTYRVVRREKTKDYEYLD